MNGNEFLDKMELVAPAYVEVADAMPTKRKVWTGWRAAVAACICLVVLAGTAAAVGGGGTWLIETFTRESGLHGAESGYRIGAEIRKYPVSELSEEIQAVRSELMKEPWREDFSSAAEAQAFIGLDTLKMLNLEAGEPWDTAVIVRGSLSGKIDRILVVSGYDVGDIVLQTITNIYTEYSDDEMARISFASQAGTIFEETFCTTASGNQCQIISSFSQSTGRLYMDAYLVNSGILYELSVSYTEPDAAQAEELLHQWADMF